MSGATRLLVFDWDGTLADSHDKIIACFHRTIKDLALPARTNDVLRATIGLSLEVAVHKLFGDAAQTMFAQFVTVFREHWLAPDAPKAKLFAGVQALLEQAQHRGDVLCVATGKSRAGLDRELDETQIRARFLATRCADETKSKPDPQMLLELLEQTGTRPEQALVIGDTTFDMEMSRAAEVTAIAVTYGAHDRAQLLACQPVACCHSVRELAIELAKTSSR